MTSKPSTTNFTPENLALDFTRFFLTNIERTESFDKPSSRLIGRSLTLNNAHYSDPLNERSRARDVDGE